MNTDMMRVLKAIVGLVVLFVLLSVVMNWYGDYKAASVAAEKATTSTAPPAGEEPKEGEGTEGEKAEAPAQKPKTVVILIEGLNMREKPAADGKRIRGLGKGDKVTLLKTQDGWYQVKASDGKTGWISANPQYSKVEE